MEVPHILSRRQLGFPERLYPGTGVDNETKAPRDDSCSNRYWNPMVSLVLFQVVLCTVSLLGAQPLASVTVAGCALKGMSGLSDLCPSVLG